MNTSLSGASSGASFNGAISKHLQKTIETFHDSHSLQFKESYYCTKRLKELNISLYENAINPDAKYPQSTFKPQSRNGKDIEITYVDWEGIPFDFINPDGENERYTRVRLENPKNPKYKYISPKGSASPAFYNGLYTYFKEQLKTIDTVYITEGEFKAFAGCKVGLPTIGVSGIHNFGKSLNDEGLTKKEYHKIYGTDEGFKTVNAKLNDDLECFFDCHQNIKNVVFLHDSDCFDNNEKEQRKASFYSSVRNFAFATKELNAVIYFAHIRPVINQKIGLDDLIQKYNINEVQDTLPQSDELNKHIKYVKIRDTIYQDNNVSKILGHIKNLFFTPDYEVIQLEENEKLSDKESEVLQKLKLFDYLILQAFTGIGKTFLFASKLKSKLKGKTVLIAPLTLIVEQTGRKYKVPFITGASNEMQVYEATHSDFIVCTYDSYHKIAKYFDNVIVDEAHELVNNVSFKPIQCTSTYSHIQQYAKKVVLLSATPTLLFIDEGYQYIKAIQPKSRKEINVIIEEKDTLSTFISTLKHISRNDVIVAEHQSKKGLESLKRDLIARGLYKEHEIQIIYRHDELEANDTYKEIKENERIKEGVKLVLCTAVTRTGINIHEPTKNIHCFTIHRENEYSLNPSDKIQFFARTREAKSIKYYAIHKKFERKCMYSFNMSKVYNEEIETAKGLCKHLNYEYYKRTDEQQKTRFKRHFVGQYVKFNDELNKYDIDILSIMNKVQSEYINTLSIEEYYSLLEHESNYYATFSHEVNELDICSEGIREQVKNEERSEQGSLIAEYAKDTKKNTTSILENVYSRTLDKDMKKELSSYKLTGLESKKFDKFNLDTLEIFAYRHIQCKRLHIKDSYFISLLHDKEKDCFISSDKFNSTIKEVEISAMLELLEKAPDHLQKHDLKNAVLYKEMIDCFEMGSQYTRCDINRNINRVLRKHHLKHEGKRKTTEYIKLLFDVEYINKSKVRYVKIGAKKSYEKYGKIEFLIPARLHTSKC